jgi:tRNA (adenine57-N1/adenine58-N1)-methyltransferase
MENLENRSKSSAANGQMQQELERFASEGSLVTLIDRKGRRYLIQLNASNTFHSHKGILPHSNIIGVREGTRVETSEGMEFLVISPTYEEYVLKMPRKATIIYPKDIGHILVYGDIFPGATVMEAGVGSGALTLMLLRAVGPHGKVISYEVREEAAQTAQKNIENFAPGMTDQWSLTIGDITTHTADQVVDRIVLDLPEPWKVIPTALDTLIDGGIFLTYVPTTLQIQKVVESLQETNVFGMISTFEVMHRNWDVSPNSVRPTHRMVAHTGFITTARKLQPGAEFPRTRKKSQY